jgi:hypothetical protein
MKRRYIAIGFLPGLVAVVVNGCTTQRQTLPARTATEQLLISTAADHATAAADLSLFAHQKVFLETTNFESYDSKYAVGGIRDALSRAGANLVHDAKDSDIVIEARAGALSIDNSETLLGIPTIGAPVPTAGAIYIPEIAIYKAELQKAYAKIALLAYANQTRAHIYSSGPLEGKSYDNYRKFMFISWTFTDIPEMKWKPAEHQTWKPQYDPKNLPPPVLLTNLPPSNLPAATNTASMMPADLPGLPKK